MLGVCAAYLSLSFSYIVGVTTWSGGGGGGGVREVRYC